MKYEKVKQKEIELIDKILNTSIDVSKVGWPQKLALEVNRSETTIRTLIKNKMPEYWNKCYTRFKKK